MTPAHTTDATSRPSRRFAIAVAALLLLPGLITLLAFGTLLSTPTSAWVVGTRSLKLTHLSRTTSGVQFLFPRELPGDQVLHSLHRRTFPRNSR